MRRCITVLLFLTCILAMGGATVAAADDTATKAQLDQMQKELDALKAQVAGHPVETSTTTVTVKATSTAKSAGFSYKDPISIKVLGTEVSLYGLADVSVDYVDNGLKNQPGAVGNNGWLAQISSNLSYFGVRGTHPFFDGKLTALFQLETEVAFTYTPGGPNPQTGDTAIVNGLGARNSYVGFIGSWGAVKVGRTDAPYKTSTARMDPFDRTIADYNAIVGNTGGDNRAEFDTRLAHALWYESPRFSGFNFGILWSPGQNRGEDNDISARGEPDCTGGNPEPCNDGSFGDAYSMSLTYTGQNFYLVTAYELHKGVNRRGDEGGPSGNVVTGVQDEWAFKIGGQFTIEATGTTINALYEYMKRENAPADYNERSRDLTLWFAVTQALGKKWDLNLGWAHAGKSPGSPGWNLPDGTPMDGPVDNSANMYSLGLKYKFDKNVFVYLVGTEMVNQQGAHFDLGASGHGAKVDCKDETGACFTGETLKGLSVGMNFRF